MDNSRFGGRDRWVTAVHCALTRSDARQMLAAKSIDPETVLAIARVEASLASDDGVTTLSHARLAEVSGLPRPAVLRVRLVLIELGLAYLAVVPGGAGNLHRELRSS